MHSDQAAIGARNWGWYHQERSAQDELATAAHFGASRSQLEDLFRKAINRREIARIHKLLSPQYRIRDGDALKLGGRPRSVQHVRRLSGTARRWLAQMLADYVSVQGGKCSRPAALIGAWRIYDAYLQTVKGAVMLAEFDGLDFDVLVYCAGLIHERKLVVQHCSYCNSLEVVIDLKYPRCGCCGKLSLSNQSPLHENFEDQSRF